MSTPSQPSEAQTSVELAQAVRPPVGAPVTGLQVPPPRLHAPHCGQLAVPQQTPSTQKPLSHQAAFPPGQASPNAPFGLQLPPSQ